MITTTVLAGVPNLEVFINRWLPQLPQARRIDIEDAKRWHAEMIALDSDRFAWYFKRLSGIAPQEIGEIAQRSMGYAATFNTVEHIIDQKLMRELPDLSNTYQRRSLLSQSMTASIFREDFGAKTQYSAIKEIGKKKLGWLSGHVDDVVEINGAIGVVCYKAHTEVPDLTYLIYQAELQAYEYLLADSRGLAHISLDELEQRTQPLVCDFMANVFLDYDEGVTKPIRVPYDGKLMRTMIESGDAVWMHITEDEPLPEWPIYNEVTPVVELTETQKMDLNLIELRLVRIKAALDKLTNYFDTTKDDMVTLMKRVNPNDFLKNVQFPLSVSSVVTKHVVDKESWHLILNGMNDDQQQAAIRATEKRTSTLDEAKVVALLESHGLTGDLDSLYKEDYDPERVINYCQANGFAPPIKEIPGISMGTSRSVAEIKPILDSIMGDIDQFIIRLGGEADTKNGEENINQNNEHNP